MAFFLKELRKAPWGARLSMVVIVIYLLIALLAPIVAPYGEAQLVGAQYEPWSARHIFGTDQLGRDILSRIIFGARNTIGIALVTTLLSFSLGVCGGFLAATFRGWTDKFLSSAVDVVMAIPSLILALLLLTIFGVSVPVMIFVIALIDATRVYRIARAVAMDVVVTEYVEAASARGEGRWWIMRREILPNALPPLLSEFGLRFCFVFLFISALSFLGLGIQPPTADWGGMVRENASLISFADVTPLIPAAAISLLTVSVNFVVSWYLHRTSGLKD